MGGRWYTNGCHSVGYFVVSRDKIKQTKGETTAKGNNVGLSSLIHSH